MHTQTIDRSAAAPKTDVRTTGLCAGTTVMTLEGEKRVEDLTPGARIITRDCGMSVLRDITVTTARIRPIRIKAGSLGHTRPDRDMVVTPGTQIHIRDWRAEALFGKPAATVDAARLVDGEFLAEQDAQTVLVYDLKFDRQHILYADGVEVLSAAV